MSMGNISIVRLGARGVVCAVLVCVSGCAAFQGAPQSATVKPMNASSTQPILVAAANATRIDLTRYESRWGNTAPHRLDQNEFLEYSVVVEKSGLYRIDYRVAENGGTIYPDTRFSLSVKGAEYPGVDFSLTSGATELKPHIYLSDGPQTLRLRALAGGATLASLELTYNENSVPTPKEIVGAMGIGINLGNTLDAIPNEGSWAPSAQPHYFSAYKEAGFKHVRIPVTWAFHQDENAPYAVVQARMNRVEEVVDWALAQGFYVILNAHHEKWLTQNYKDANVKARFDALWTQVADRFQNKSPRLLFEILNEPVEMSAAEVDELNSRILNIMRVDNPTRAVIFSGHKYTTVDELLITAIPSSSDRFLIGNFHSYNPWPFAGNCVQKWGSQQDYQELEDIYVRAQAWSKAKGIPVTVNEFGVAHFDREKPEYVCDQKQRMQYLKAVVKFASQRGIAATVWDDNNSFAVYRRQSASWGPEKDVIVAPNVSIKSKP